MSLTTVAVIPATLLVLLVTCIRSSSFFPFSTPRYTKVRPTGSGKYGLSIAFEKCLAGGMCGLYAAHRPPPGLAPAWAA